MKLALVSLLSLVGCGGGSGSSFPTNASNCKVDVTGGSVKHAVCIEAESARIRAVRVDASGDVVVAGSFQGRLAWQASAPMGTSKERSSVSSALGQSFIAKLAPELTTARYAKMVDAPGVMRGVMMSSSSDGSVSVVSATPDAEDGPYLTRLDRAGNVTLRKDLGFHGLVSSAAMDASNTLVLRVHQNGVRVVVASHDGNVLASPQVAPSWVPQFPASVAGDSLVPDVALAPGAAFVVHAAEGDALGDHAVTKLNANGTVSFTRAAPIGPGAQVVATAGGHLAVLTPRAGASCPGAIAKSFSVTALDGNGAVKWQKCFLGEAADLHLAVDRSDRVIIGGTMRGTIDFGDGRQRRSAAGVGSFVVRLGDKGEVRKVMQLTGSAPIVALHGIAGDKVSDGVIIAGAIARDSMRQSHLFVATLQD